ncbi:hypothetical protein [Actinoplanes philippinensis]|uniref:hypothetical protein n=1 Tax=Actinoplanes philippinensis TaxID=35752 RepID=UPI0033E3C6B0
MTVSSYALLAATALTGGGALLATVPPSPAPYDAAFVVFAYGDQPLSVGPNAYSSSSGTSENTGGARSADGWLVVGWGHAIAGEGHADAVATDITVLGGAIRAAAVIAHCRQGAVTSRAVDVTGDVNGTATVAYDVRTKNQDGSTTVVGMQIRVHSGDGTVINIASATCAPQQDRPKPPPTAPDLTDHTAGWPGVPGRISNTRPHQIGVVTQAGILSAGS